MRMMGWAGLVAYSNMMPYWGKDVSDVLETKVSGRVYTWYGLVALPLLPETVMSTALHRHARRGSTREAFIVGAGDENTMDQDFTKGPCLSSLVCLM